MALERITTEVRGGGRVSACRIKILTGPRAGEEVALPQVGVTVGAQPGAGVRLDDPAVSGRHASVVPVESGFEVKDLGSRNGTWVDGVSIERARVPLGTVIRVGETLLQLMPEEQIVALPPSVRTSFGRLIGVSHAMRTVFTALERASATSAPVLLLGESGTGKELAARAVHEASPRASGPFVVFDCGAASDTLIESELFGHEKGAFTGAHEARPGAFALAHGGTLFLDEIGDLPLPLQPKLLRLLESGEVRPLGGRKAQRHDVRVVAATHHDLLAEVDEGAFRADLYYRLAVVELLLPALRQRRDDVPGLVEHFLRAGGHDGANVAGPALDRLRAYAWPGNVRELRNVVARALALSPPATPFERLPFLLRPPARAPAEAPLFTSEQPYHEAKEALLRRFERDYLADLVARHGDNLSAAARAAGIERKYLYRLLEKAGLALPERGRLV